jgi:HEAT repeat protein
MSPISEGGWSGWTPPPGRREEGGSEDSSGEARSDASSPDDPESYETDWYRSLKALAARTEESRDEDPIPEARADTGERASPEGIGPNPAMSAFGDLASAAAEGAAASAPADAIAGDVAPAAGPAPALDAIDGSLRRRALADLGEVPTTEVDRVLGMTLDPDVGVRREALGALISRAESLPDDAVRRALLDPSDDVRAEAVRLAARRGARDIASLMPLLGDRRSPATQAAALETLPRILAPGLPLNPEDVAAATEAIEKLESRPNETERDPLAELAGAIGVGRLLQLVEVPDRRRLGAVRLLSLDGSMAAMRGLSALHGDPIEEIRVEAARASARIHEAERITTVPEAVGGSPVSVERAAESEMLAALARALEDPEEGVRGRARAALLDVERAVIARWVTEALQAGDEELARLAAEVARLLSLSEVATHLLGRGASVRGERQEPYRRALASLPLEAEALMTALTSVDPERRPLATRLVWIVAGRAALPLLRRSMADANAEVRIAVLQVLADAGDDLAVETARRALASDASPDVRVATIAVLSRARADERIRSLAQALMDPDPSVRAEAVAQLPDGLGRETLGILTRALQDPDERVWHAALPHIAAFPADEVPFVWDTLAAAGGEQREAMIAALEGTGSSTIADLALAHAGSLDPTDRELAIDLAGHCQSDACAQACVTSLQDPVVAVRRTAAASLSRLKSPASVPSLGVALQDPDPEVRIAALGALGVIDSEAVLGFLVSALGDPNAAVRASASAVLTEWSSPAVARRLAGVLATPALRDQATQLLRKMGPSAAELLVDVLLRSSSKMAPTVGGLLDSIVGIEAFARRLESADPQQRRRAIIAIKAIGGPRAVVLATRMLADPDRHLRTAALEALADLDDPSTATAVEEVADHDPVDEVAETARWVLDTLGQRDEGTSVEQPS